jgi:hypothetical protein
MAAHISSFDLLQYNLCGPPSLIFYILVNLWNLTQRISEMKKTCLDNFKGCLFVQRITWISSWHHHWWQTSERNCVCVSMCSIMTKKTEQIEIDKRKMELIKNIEIRRGEPNHKQETIKSLQYLHRQTNLYTKGSFHENGQCNYVKILNYIFSLRLLCEYFMIRIMKVLLKCCSMAIECVNPIRWRYSSFAL